MKKCFMFDCDGTLLDTKDGIIESFKLTLEEATRITKDDKYKNMTEKEISRFIGPSLTTIFGDYLGFYGDDQVYMIAFFRGVYREKGIYNYKLYQGIDETLRYLKSKDKQLVVCSSKSQDTLETVLKHANLFQYFDIIIGKVNGRDTKDLVIKEALRIGCINKETALMIGDRSFDIEESYINNVDGCAVKYGYYQNINEFDKAKYIVETPTDLLELLKEV